MMKNLLLLTIIAAFSSSCTVVQPAWEGTKDGVNTVVGAGEEVLTSVWGGGKSLVATGIDAAEGVVTGAYDVVTDPLTGEGEE